MISRGQGFILRHDTGAFLVSHWNVREQVVTYAVTSDALSATTAYNRERAFPFLGKPEWQSVASQWEIVDHPCCGCCGYHYRLREPVAGLYRCDKHSDRNPCAIEGCLRTIAVRSNLNDGRYWLCSEHWRVACPPGSPERRVYLRIRRAARKRGYKVTERWPQTMENRYWRIWSRIVAIGRARCAGDIDMTEINKLFGWDEAA